MTKHCCQVCVLSLMFCRLDCRLCAWWVVVSGNFNTTWFDLNTPTGQHGKWYEKYFLHLISTFYLNRDTSVTELFPVVVLKKKSRVDSFTDNESKPSRIVVERSETMLILICWYILLQTRIRIMTINQHNSVLHAFSVPNWSEICGVVDVLTVLLLSPTR